MIPAVTGKSPRIRVAVVTYIVTKHLQRTINTDKPGSQAPKMEQHTTTPTMTLTKFIVTPLLFACLTVNTVNAQEQSSSLESNANGAANSNGENGAPQLQEIEVRIGIIGSILRALRDKKSANQIKDVISAEDIGKLPDQNVAEALQRITGVQISRDFGDGDQVAVRGFAQNRIEIDGQSTMGSNSESRGISFNDLAPDAFSSIEVIKTPTASMTEGSLGGTINLKTRKAFSSRGTVLSGRIQAEHVEKNHDTNPLASLFASTRWDTPFGEMGVSTSISYQDQTRTRDTSELRWKEYNQTTRTVFDPSGILIADTSSVFFAPQQIKFQHWNREQERLGIVTGFQWRPTDELEVYIDANHNDFEIATASNSVQALFGSNNTIYTEGIITDSNSLISAYADRTFGNTNGWSQNSDRQTYAATLGMKYDTEQWSIESLLSNSHGRTDQNNSFFSTPFLGGPEVRYSQLNTEVPTLDFTVGGASLASTALSSYRIQNLTIQDVIRKNDNIEAKLDIEYRLETDHLSSFKLGYRYAKRDAFRDRNSDSNQLFNGAAVTDVPIIANRMQAFPSDFLNGFSGGSYAYLTPRNDDFFSNSEIFELYNVNLANDLSQDRDFFYDIEERTLAAYMQANFEGYIFDIPYAANIGIRRIGTRAESSGWQDTDGVETLISQANQYTDNLFSGNIGFAIRDNLLLRLAMADVMSRPRIEDLSSATKINIGDNTGRSGNIKLKPFRAQQYDISVEWYATDTDFLSAALFYKDVESFIVRSREDRVITRFDLPDQPEQIFDISLPFNGEGGKVKGFEIAFTKTFGFLGEEFGGAGITTSYTFADSETPNRNIVTGEELPLEDLSKNSYNVIAFYEYKSFSARLAYNWRSEFLDKTQGFNQQPEFERDRGQLDFSASYRLTKKIRLTFNGINLADDANDQYQAIEERDYKKTSIGRRYTLSLSARL